MDTALVSEFGGKIVFVVILFSDSGGSTTISATSSPGLAEVNDDSNPHVPMNNKEEEEVKPPVEMSPRKKPRKQQL